MGDHGIHHELIEKSISTLNCEMSPHDSNSDTCRLGGYIETSNSILVQNVVSEA
jgi:hypothetical protein